MYGIYWIYRKFQNKVIKNQPKEHLLQASQSDARGTAEHRHLQGSETNDDDSDFMSLVEACREGDVNRYHKLTTPLEFNKDLLKMKDNMGWTVLFHAVYGGSHDIVYSLVGYKEMDLYQRDNIGRTVLHLAAKKGNIETFDAILQKVSEIDLMQIKDKNGLMPYCYAALAGQKSILEDMRSRGFDITKVTKYGESIAHLACIGESLDVLNMASKIDEEHSTQESMNNEEEIIKRKNKMDWNTLQYAAKSGNTKILKFLHDKNVLLHNPTEDMKSVLHSACENGHLEACKYIAQHYPERIHATDKNGRHAGHFVAKCGDVELLKYLIEDCKLQANASSSQNINILHIACCHGRLDICIYIADKYPDLVKQESKKGWNASLFIGEKGGADEDRIEILKNLVNNHNLFVYHVSRAGKTILYNACANRSYMLCEHLLENYPNLLTVERSMDPRNAARDSRITTLI
ncbi:putative ankyrin repeat protein RF_0381 [Saccostrea cucullata]|uniref:putative ankyrin repeat protein RF_0381 n=1 Tax=Saccostrea cuccullata TaxID=36930 RepID=UPI002ED2719E